MNSETLCTMMLSAMECPFCGSTELNLIESETAFSITCTACRASGPAGNSAEQALEHWNWTGQFER